jgi:hypothetical protein
MALGTSLVADLTPHVANGEMQAQTITGLKAAYPGQVYVANRSFTMNYHGHHLAMTKGLPQVLDPTLLAALTAAGAPITPA